MSRPTHFDDVEYLLDGFEHVETVEEFRGRLKLGRPLNVKLGIDPTSSDLHLGFMVVLNRLQRFAASGHNVTLIIGDFTALIGDPSGKKIARPQLTAEEIEANMETYREQAARVLDLDLVKIRYNSEWLGALSSSDFIRLAGKTTVAQMLERNDFRERHNAGDAISLHELLYPVAMAYDSVVTKADVELGGIDQLFNLLMGRHYQREFGQPPQICAMAPLLIGLDGVQKMSKSLGNYVGVTESPEVQFGKLMSMPDELIPMYARHAAFREKPTTLGANPMEEKKEVAQEIVARYHGPEAASRARAFFEATVQRKELPQEMPEIVLGDREARVADVLRQAQFAQSRRAAERLISGGGVRVDLSAVSDPNARWTWVKPVVLSVGSRKFARVKPKSESA